MNMLDRYKTFCTPAKIYLTIAVIVSFIQLFSVPVFIVFINFLFAIFWTYILGWLCNKGFSSVSWFLVLLPYVVMLMQALGFISFSSFTILTSR
jgi:hypothetical protein